MGWTACACRGKAGGRSTGARRKAVGRTVGTRRKAMRWTAGARRKARWRSTGARREAVRRNPGRGGGAGCGRLRLLLADRQAQQTTYVNEQIYGWT